MITIYLAFSLQDTVQTHKLEHYLLLVVPEVISRKGLLLFGDSARTIQYGVVGPAGALVVLDITIYGLLAAVVAEAHERAGVAVVQPELQKVIERHPLREVQCHN